MKRKMTVTVSGKDGEKQVDVGVKFDPPLDKTGPPPSGWQNAASILFEAVQSLAGEEDDSDAGHNVTDDDGDVALAGDKLFA